MDDKDREEIKQFIKDFIQEATKPRVALCMASVLQDSSCRLSLGHTGLHVDQDGVWRCPWCNKDAFWGHTKDCPAAEAEKEEGSRG